MMKVPKHLAVAHWPFLLSLQQSRESLVTVRINNAPMVALEAGPYDFVRKVSHRWKAPCEWFPALGGLYNTAGGGRPLNGEVLLQKTSTSKTTAANAS